MNGLFCPMQSSDSGSCMELQPMTPKVYQLSLLFQGMIVLATLVKCFEEKVISQADGILGNIRIYIEY